MDEAFRTGLISRLASLSPQDFQSVVSAATGRRIRNNSKPIPKKLYAKMMTRAKALKRGKILKVPFKLEGHFEVHIGINDDDSYSGTNNVKLRLKPGVFTGDTEIEQALMDFFWEVDESDSSEFRQYREALTEISAIHNELTTMVEEACANYGHDTYDFLEKLFEEAEKEVSV